MRIPEELGSGVFGALIGSVAAMAIGFSFGGWVTQTNAEEQARFAAYQSAQSVMVDLCVSRSLQDPNRLKVLSDIKKSNGYTHAQIIVDAGWATMPWQSNPNQAVAERCEKRISAEL